MINIVIVNYFKARRLAQGLKSIADQSYEGEIKVIVVDNSCSASEFRELKSLCSSSNFTLIQNTHNFGYTAGVNLGAKYADPTGHIVLMSPDIIIKNNNVLADLTNSINADPTLGVVSPVQHDDDGQLVEIARRFPSPMHQIRRKMFQQNTDIQIIERISKYPNLHEVDWIQSSFIMINRSAWDDLGGLNTKYFLFMSDIEICKAAWDGGYKVCIDSKIAGVVSDGIRASGGSMLKLLKDKVVRIHARDAIRYYLSHGFKSHQRPQN